MKKKVTKKFVVKKKVSETLQEGFTATKKKYMALGYLSALNCASDVLKKMAKLTQHPEGAAALDLASIAISSAALSMTMDFQEGEQAGP